MKISVKSLGSCHSVTTEDTSREGIISLAPRFLSIILGFVGEAEHYRDGSMWQKCHLISRQAGSKGRGWRELAQDTTLKEVPPVTALSSLPWPPRTSLNSYPFNVWWAFHTETIMKPNCLRHCYCLERPFCYSTLWKKAKGQETSHKVG